MTWVISIVVLVVSFLVGLAGHFIAARADREAMLLKRRLNYVEYESPFFHTFLDLESLDFDKACVTCGMDDLPTSGGSCFWCLELEGVKQHLESYREPPKRVMRSRREDAVMRRMELESQAYAEAYETVRKQHADLKHKYESTEKEKKSLSRLDVLNYESQQYRAMLEDTWVLDGDIPDMRQWLQDAYPDDDRPTLDTEKVKR